MAGRIDAYVDTSALIAFADASDTYHPVFRRFDRVRALQFLAMLDDMPFIDVRPVGTPELQGAAAMLRRFGDQDLTLVDAVGLHLMRDGHVASCRSTDRHLGLTGTPLAIHAA
jgi:predicted nucleic acid-binding protein